MFNPAVGREKQSKQIPLACVGSALSVSAALGLPPLGVCAFPVYTAQVPGCSAGKLSRAGPGLRALPRSEPLGFRFSGTSQRHRLSWACVLCPSQVRAAQAPRCLRSTLSPGGAGRLTAPPHPPPPVPAARFRSLGCAVCLLWGADLRLRPSW